MYTKTPSTHNQATFAGPCNKPDPAIPAKRAPCVAHAQLFRKQEQLAVKASATIDRALHPEDGALGDGGGGGGGAGYGYGDGGNGNDSNV